MSNFKAFLRDKGLYLLCLALIMAAAVTSIWAIRSVVQNVSDYTKAKQQAEQKENAVWEQPQAEVNNPVTDLPKPTPVPSAQPSAPPSSSGAQSASGSGPAGAAGGAGQSGRQGSSSTASLAPVSGKLSQPYSGDELVYSKTLGDWRTHNGADYACKAGDAVTACRTGVVNAAYTDALWGGVVELNDADGVTWRYCGLAEPAVAKGEEIKAGEPLGRAGALPGEAADGVHLHLECLRGEQWLDPAALLGK